MKTKLLLAGLLAGAMAFGTACKTDKGNTNNGTGTDTTTMGTDSGTGGAGLDNPDHNRQGVNPVPEEGMREMEPGVHEGTQDEPGTGGAGLEDDPLDRNNTLGGETSEEPLNPGAPATGGDEGSMRDEGMSEPRH